MVEQKMVSEVHKTLDELLLERRELMQKCIQMSELAATATEFADKQAQVMEAQREMIERFLQFEIQAKDFLQDLADRATGEVVCFQQMDLERVDYLLSFKPAVRR